MKILVVNSGSSSVKYKVFEVDGVNQELASGVIERIGTSNADLKCSCCFPSDPRCAARMFGEPGKLEVHDHRRAVDMICELLQSDHFTLLKGSRRSGLAIASHGGEEFWIRPSSTTK